MSDLSMYAKITDSSTCAWASLMISSKPGEVAIRTGSILVIGSRSALAAAGGPGSLVEADLMAPSLAAGLLVSLAQPNQSANPINASTSFDPNQVWVFIIYSAFWLLMSRLIAT
jgi:hypothetical protein